MELNYKIYRSDNCISIKRLIILVSFALLLSGGVAAQSLFTESGGVETFTTDDYSVTTNGTNGIGDRSLNMTGDIHNLSDLEVPIEVFFNITDQSDGTTTKVDAGKVDGSGVISVVETGLDPDTTYSFKACTNHYCGSENSATTSTYNVSTVSDTDVGVDWIRFRGKISNVAQFTEDINDRIDLYIDYRPVGDSWSTVKVTDRVNDGFFEQRVDGLQQGTTYEYKAYSGDNIEGNVLQASTLPGVFTVSGGVVTFSTGTLFNVSIIDVKNPVIEGEDIEVDFEVENEGAQGIGNVTLSVPGVGTNKSEYNLTGGEVVQNTITLGTSAGDSGEYTANISSDSDFATRDFNISELNAPVSPIPVDGEDAVGLNENLSVKSNTSGVDVNIEFYLNGSDEFIGSQTGISYNDRANTSLSSIDPDPNTTYEWYALTEYNGETVKSEVYNFTSVERPEVLSIEPANNTAGVGKNPVLNATVGGNAQIDVKFHDYDKASSQFYSTTISSGGTSSYDLQNYGDMGEGVTERWWIELESKGAQWNNSDDPYEFTVSEASEVNYNAVKFEEGDNLNPGKFGSLNTVLGPKTVSFKVSNPEGVEMGNIGLNITNSTFSDTSYFNQVADEEKVSLDVSNVIDQNSNYNITAFYQEGATKFTGVDFTTSDLKFSSHVAEIEFTHSGDNVNEFRVLYNESSASNYNSLLSVPVEDISSDSNDLYEIGVANSGLKDNSQNDCYQVEAWNRFGAEKAGYQNGNDRCLGGSNP